MNAENRIKRIQPPFDYNTVCPTFSVILFAHTRNRCPPSPLFRDGVLAIGGASRISGTFPPDRTRRFRKTVIIPLFVTAVFQAKEVDTIRIWSNLKSDGFRAPLLLWPFVRRTRLPSSYETNPLGERFFFSDDIYFFGFTALGCRTQTKTSSPPPYGCHARDTPVGIDRLRFTYTTRPRASKADGLLFTFRGYDGRTKAK